jgi:cytochrome c553
MEKKMNKSWSVSLLAALICSAPLAQAQGGSAAGAGKAKAASCAGCHGEDGNSAMPGFPKLAGQHTAYLVKQLLAFKKGERISPMMAPLATGLDEKSIQEIADYYAANKISTNPPPSLPANDDDDDAPKTEEQKHAELAAVLAEGRDLYLNGDLPKQVSACVACHGPYAEGNKPAAYPSLHSQHADYLIKTLKDFKNGARSHNKENVMSMIAAKMSDDEIKAVAYYISTMK